MTAERPRLATRRLALLAAVVLLTLALVVSAILVGASLLPRNSAPIPPSQGGFTPTAALSEARWGHFATLLDDGSVVIAGGSNGHGPIYVGDATSLEVFDPKAQTFSQQAQPAQLQGTGYTATHLPDGQVLLLEYGRPDLVNAATLWDPAKGSFTPTGSLRQFRAGYTVTVLPNGRVLVIGGFGDDADSTLLVTAEVWDPATGRFDLAGLMAEARRDHTASLLADGRVLVAGGYHDVFVQQPDETYVGSSVAMDSVEIWDPASDTFSVASPLLEARAGATATVLPDGRVLLVAGWGVDGPLASAELWDPATEAFSPAGSMSVPRGRHTATLLPDGRVLVVGGDSTEPALASAELWDPRSETFSPTGSLVEGRSTQTATVLADGRVLIVGGDGTNGTLATAEIYALR